MCLPTKKDYHCFHQALEKMLHLEEKPDGGSMDGELVSSMWAECDKVFRVAAAGTKCDAW